MSSSETTQRTSSTGEHLADKARRLGLDVKRLGPAVFDPVVEAEVRNWIAGLRLAKTLAKASRRMYK